MSRQTVYVIMCVIVLFLSFLLATHRFSLAHASQTTVSVYPSSLVIRPGDNITVTVTVTDVSNLFLWQGAMEYNASVIRLSDAWVPQDNVFQGQSYVAVGLPISEVNALTADGLNYNLIGATLASGSVNVSSGTLFKVNFTAIDSGATAIRIGTRANPIMSLMYPASWDSFLLDLDLNEMPFVAESGFASVTSFGGVYVPVGVNVTVSPTGGLGLTFANVTGAGSVTANKTLTVQAPPLANLTGQYYDIKVTADYIGNVTVSVAYDDSNMTLQQENNLQMMQYTPIPGDIQPPFGVVDMRDIAYIARRFATNPTSPLWDPAADITGPQYLVPDGKIDMRDIAFVARWFGGQALWINVTVYVDTVNNIIYGVTNHFSLIGIH